MKPLVVPSQTRTATENTATPEKPKIIESLATDRGSAFCDTSSVSRASSSRKGSSGVCSSRSVKVRRRSSNCGCAASALRAAERRLRRITGITSAAPMAAASPRKRKTRALTTLPLEKENWLITSTANTVRASAKPAVTAMPRVSASSRRRFSMAPRYSLNRSKGFMPPLFVGRTSRSALGRLGKPAPQNSSCRLFIYRQMLVPEQRLGHCEQKHRQHHVPPQRHRLLFVAGSTPWVQRGPLGCILPQRETVLRDGC